MAKLNSKKWEKCQFYEENGLVGMTLGVQCSLDTHNDKYDDKRGKYVLCTVIQFTDRQ